MSKCKHRVSVRDVGVIIISKNKRDKDSILDDSFTIQYFALLPVLLSTS